MVLVAGTSIACRCSELLIVNGPILQSVTVALKWNNVLTVEGIKAEIARNYMGKVGEDKKKKRGK